jgi:rhombotail lipoprotein
MRIPFRLAVLAGLAALAGCASQRVQETSSSVVQFLYPKGAPASVQQGAVTLTLPVTVGIAFVPPANDASRHYGPAYFLGGSLSQTEQYQLLQKVAAHFKKYDFIKSIQIIPQNYLTPGGGWTDLSAVAKMYGVDIVALVSYDQVQVTSEDALSLTYLTIVGAYVIPAEKNTTSTFVDTTVFDTATHNLLFRAPGISKVHGRSALMSNSGALQHQSNVGYEKAVDQMIANLDTALGNFRQTVKEQPEAYKLKYRNEEAGGGGAVDPLSLFVLFALAGSLAGRALGRSGFRVVRRRHDPR